MGWQDTQRTNQRFPESVGYKRVNWKELNPAKDVYDWASFEKLQKQTAQSGSLISFRVRPAQPPPWGEGHTMPDWLVKQGAMIAETESDILEGVISTEPLYAGCLFLESHAQFINAMRQRYDGDPNVAFIDIGSYGNYGEWASEQYDESPNSLDWHARRRLIDMYLGGQGTRPCLESNGQISQVTYDYPGFQQTQLIMPYTPWFADSLRYALNRRYDIGIRHDALGSERHQRKYREEIGDLVQARWLYAPIIFEYYPDAYSPDALRSARDFALEMHTSFLHENFNDRGHDDLIESLLESVGYRLMLQEISYNSEPKSGQSLTVEMLWENGGVALPYYQTYPLLLSLTNSQGQPLLTQQLDPDIRTWLPGKPIHLTGTMPLPTTVSPGTYDLRLAFVDPISQQPILNLPLTGQDEAGWYLIGPVEILP